MWQSRGIVCHAMPNGWRYASSDPEVPACLCVSRDYTRLTAWLPACGDEARGQEKLLHLIRTAVECSFPLHGAISLHAACVALDGGAVAFAAPSGTGKSARAKRWVDSLGARYISGDRPAIRFSAEGAVACGVPWDGKERIFVQAQSPLIAICEVRRAPFIRVRRLSRAQARKLLLKQCFLPLWDSAAAAAALNVIERLAASVSVYRVFGGMDSGPAFYTHSVLFNQSAHSCVGEEKSDMKIKDGFMLRHVVDEYIVMPVGKNIDTFEGVLVLNDVSAFIWEQLKRPICREDLLELVLGEFDVRKETAVPDLDAFLDRLRGHGVLEEE